MKCPHCLVEIHAVNDRFHLKADAEGDWHIERVPCPACGRYTLTLQVSNTKESRSWVVHPRATARAPLSPHVPANIASDYGEACLVLADSPKASAALSRRCLQHVLRTAGNIKPDDLAKEIDEVLPTLPAYLRGTVDAVRVVGNFAAHPIKALNTGEILDVEPEEAETNLAALEGLFNFYYVLPKIEQAKRDALNTKLMLAGKPPLK